MEYLSRQFKQILLITGFLFYAGMLSAQTKVKDSREFKSFSRMANRANVALAIPEGFKEIEVKNDNPAFDYGIKIPDQDFEIWLKIMPQTESTPDSVYLETGKAQAKQLAGDNQYLVREMPDRVLSDYNADAGKTYFFNLPDALATKRYKFALLITLQKNHKGTIMAICLNQR
jgi:hypothetical protein